MISASVDINAGRISKVHAIRQEAVTNERSRGGSFGSAPPALQQLVERHRHRIEMSSFSTDQETWLRSYNFSLNDAGDVPRSPAP
jgi:hypothetical protein